MSHASESRKVGFTLVELLVVIAIIGILISLILVAAADGVRRAEERATQSLITKLEGALNDRMDALLNTIPPINQFHRYLAAINVVGTSNNYYPIGLNSTNNSYDRRAQVIAQFDYIRAELPDVFFVNTGLTDASANYPLNFAAVPIPNSGTLGADFNYALPIGNYTVGLPLSPTNTLAIPAVPTATSGMYGASFSAAGGIYKNLGYQPAGYDGADNDGDGLIDNITESGMTLAAVQAKLASHTHKTARAEMLYAILVEGLGPLGSSFSREDFTAREVQDTDNDGLPEFVDAWGEPLQFYRWPLYYGGTPTPNLVLGTSDSQLGAYGYATQQTREQDPIDPNQLLAAPAWWYSGANASVALYYPALSSFLSAPNSGSSVASSGSVSPSAIGFMNCFHSIVDPLPGLGIGWDRGGAMNRREYFTKFLILSGGPDHEPGTAQLNKEYGDLNNAGSDIYAFPSGSMTASAYALLYIENQASVGSPTARNGSFFEYTDYTGTPSSAASPTATTMFLQQSANSDDISNHNISGPSTGVR